VQYNRTLAHHLTRAFRLFAALVGAGGVLTALAFGIGWAWFTPEFERGRLSVKAEGAAHAAMLDEENGLRGYLLARDPSFLEPYTRAQEALTRAHRALAASIGSTPELVSTMLSVRLAEERWTERWARAVGDLRPGATAPSVFDGKVLFDAYRLEEAAFADALERRSQGLFQREQRMIVTRLALELSVFLAILILALREERALRDAIVTPVAALLGHIRRIRDGQLTTSLDQFGPRELAELAEGLNELVQALVAARGSEVSREEAQRQHAGQLRLILDASREFSESLNLVYVVKAVRESTRAVGGYERVVVWLMDEEQKNLVSTEDSSSTSLADGESDSGRGLAARACTSGRITFESPTGQVRFGDSNTGPIRAIAIPLIVGARVVGAIEARYGDTKLATKQTIEILETLATHAATAIESARLHGIIETRSHVDPLTRLFNRRRLDADMDTECKRSARYGRPLSFVMLDVDHFKAFNDTHGHPQADVALQLVADVIGACVRSTDTAYRYGGEEFCILLRETCAEDGMIMAERVRLRIEQRFASGDMAGITASFGVAGLTVATSTPRTLMEAADAAMYEAKHTGRNCVALSAPFPAPRPTA
jgi:diguanylate cyclase (GGDEF)-like protein